MKADTKAKRTARPSGHQKDVRMANSWGLRADEMGAILTLELYRPKITSPTRVCTPWEHRMGLNCINEGSIHHRDGGVTREVESKPLRRARE